MRDTRLPVVARSLAGLAGGLLLATLSLGMLIGPLGQPAEAHADLTGSDPSEEELLEEAPDAVELYFTEPVELAPGESVQVFRADGVEIQQGPPELVDDGATVRVVIDPGDDDEAQGTFTVSWHVLSQDGHNIEGTFLFHVGGETEAVEVAEEDQSIEVAGYVGRWLAFAGSVTALGVTGLALAAPSERAVRARLRLFAVTGGLVGAVGVAVMLVTQVAETLRVGWFDAIGEVPDAFGARVEDLMGARFLMLVLVAFLAMVFWRLKWAPLPILGCGVASLALASLTSHAWSSDQRDLAVVSDTIHFTAVSIWIGGVLALLVSLGVAKDRAGLARRFSAMALSAVVVVVPTGITLAWQHVGELGNLTGTRYGQILLAKVLLFALLMVIGYMNKTRLVDLAERTIRPLSGSLRVEVFVAIGVLSITSALVHQAPGRSETGPNGGGSGEVAQGASGGAENDGGSFSQVLPADEPPADGSTAELQLDVLPAAVGENAMEMHFLGDDGAPLDVTVASAQISIGDQSPRGVQLQLLSPSHGSAEGVAMPQAGTWTVQVDAVTAESNESVTFTFEVPIT